MGDNRDAAEKTIDKSAEAKAGKLGDSGAARQEAGQGMQGLSDQAKAYREARKSGLRDKSTMEHLGVQPEFFDSSAATNQLARFDKNNAAKGDVAKDEHPNRPVVRDDDHKVTDVHYPDGTSAHIKYDRSSNPTEIKTADGTWKNEKDGWNCYDDKNRKNGHLDGEMKVGENGSIVARQKDGYTETYSPDGKLKKEGFPDGHKETIESNRREIEDAQGNKTVQHTYNGSEVSTDAQGKATSIKRADGKTTGFEYDADNNLSKIKNPDGTEIRHEYGGWYKYDKNGLGQGKDEADYKVSSDGTVTRAATDGKPTEVTHIDNTREVKYKNGAEMDYDKNGRLERSVYPGDKVLRFDYDKHGQLQTVQEYSKDQEFKQSFQKGADGKWFMVDKNRQTYDVDKKYGVTPTGEVVETDRNGNNPRMQYYSPDKS